MCSVIENSKQLGVQHLANTNFFFWGAEKGQLHRLKVWSKPLFLGYIKLAWNTSTSENQGIFLLVLWAKSDYLWTSCYRKADADTAEGCQCLL